MAKEIFTQDFLQAQEKKLLQEKIRLEKELAVHGRRRKRGDDYAAKFENLGDDEESNAAEYGLNEANLDLVQNLQTELRRVLAALARIKKGGYGVNSETGKPISRRRLEIYPPAESDV